MQNLSYADVVKVKEWNQVPQILETKEETNAAFNDEMSFSTLGVTAENIFENLAKTYENKTKKTLGTLKAEVAQKSEELNRSELIIKNLKAENRALKQRLERLNKPAQSPAQLQASVVAISEKFKVLETLFAEQKVAYDTSNVDDYKLKSRALNHAWSYENKELKLLANEVEKLFIAHAINSKAIDSDSLNALSKSWSAVSICDYKLEKSKQHLALKQMLKEFLGKLEESHQTLISAAADLSKNKFNAPGVKSGVLSWYIDPEQKEAFETHLNSVKENFEKHHAIALEKEADFIKMFSRFALLPDQSIFARRLAAGNEIQAFENIKEFEALQKDTNLEKQALHNQLAKKWNEFNAAHINLYRQIAILENGLATADLTFPSERNVKLDEQKLLKLKPAAIS